jgi:hypothetical protein
VALKEGRESVNGGRYDWAEAFGKGDYEILGEEPFLERGTVFPSFLIFFWLGVWEDSCRSAPGCWEFWAWGPGILMESWS